jgi:5-methylthioadenosine/S-adenosylhomocysteine deaminase
MVSRSGEPGSQVISKILLSGGCVLTLGPKTPSFTRADVLIDGETVAEIGIGLRARDAEHVDATDTIVMPGFVDTHRHAWRSLSRNNGASPPDGGAAGSGDELRPDDVYAATLIGLLGAIEAGITTVVDWSPIRPDDALVDAALRAHADAGLRTAFVHAPRAGTEDQGSLAPAIRQLVARLTDAAGPFTTIAFGSDMPDAKKLERVAAEWKGARELGLRIHVHADPETSGPGVIAELARRGLLREDVTLVHCSSLDDADVDAIAASGAAVSLAPSSVMASGLVTPPIQPLIDRDIRPGLGVDEERLTPGDLFAQMRATISLQHATVFDRKLAGKAGVPKLMSTRDVIRHATVDGARAAGLGGVTGSLEPGKQADIVMLRTDRPNIFPINDPVGAVVWGMDTSNVDWVFVAGRPLMRNGALEANVERARNLATTAQHRVATAAGITIGTAPGGEW